MDSSASRNSDAVRLRGRWSALAPIMVAIGLATLVFMLLQIAATLPVIQVSVEGASAELSPTVPVSVSLSKAGVTLVDAALIEEKRDIDGVASSSRSVPVQLSPVGSDGISYLSELRLQSADGANPLDYDVNYLLRLTISRWQPALPLPREVLEVLDFPFQTLTTPRVHVPGAVVELHYRQPLRLSWNSDVERFSVVTEPALDVSSWVDPDRGNTAFVDLNKADPGRRYLVKVVEALGVNGAPLTVPAELVVETAAMPEPIPGSVKVEDGNRVAMRWDTPLKSFDYEIEPFIPATAIVDPEDPSLSYLLLRDPPQQQEYTIRILDGTSVSGAPLAKTYEFTVSTPDQLYVVDVGPTDGSFGVSLNAHIDITFSTDIQDREAAEAAISIEPAVAGYFDWLAPNQVRFVPEERLPEMTDMVITVSSGPRGARGVDGGYLDEGLQTSFLTRPDKLIEVDLSKQLLVLYERDEPVFSTVVATGVRGAETPVGEFTVNFKLPATRMRGVNPDGSRYDIPSVPWVMSFLGDYTIHAAPWRSTFGFPQSNGCVGMDTGSAKHLYDMTPVGTPVLIHY